MEMALHGPMGTSRFSLAAITAFALLCSFGAGQSTTTSGPSSSAAAQSSQQSAADQSAPPSGSSTSTTIHRKTGPDSSQTIRHIRVAEESDQLPELTQAEVLIQKRDNAAAEPLLLKAVGHEPANYEAWFDLGFVENGLGKVDESIVAYRKSVAAKPDVFESNLNLGLQLAKTGQPDAEQFLRAATQLKPTSHAVEGQYRAWLSLGHVLALSKPAEAVDAYRKAAGLQPNEAEPHVAAGQVLEKQQHYADSEEEYKRALAIDPASDALTGLANAYMQERRFPEAEEYLRKLVNVHPDEAAPYIQLGGVLAAQGKNEAAIAELQAGLKISPNDFNAQRDLADVCVAAGKPEQAEKAYRALIGAHPQDAGLHRALGQALLRQKKFPEAQQEFVTTIKLKPDFGEAYGDLAFAASENKDYALTIKALDVRAKLIPEVPITYFLRASAFDHLKDVKKAAANYRLFLQTAGGKYPDQEWQAKHRLIALEPKK
jgi:tetratricopeptide (TPR) repeat protein